MLLQLQSLIKACNKLGCKYSFFDDNQNCIIVSGPKQKIYFVNSAVSINSDTDNNIAVDKFFTYKLLKIVINMPQSTCYVDPFIEVQYAEYVKNKNYDLIADAILNKHHFPLVVKTTRQTHGTNVFKCDNRDDVIHALKTIFDHKSKTYDYTVLAQQYIKAQSEYRIITLDGKIQFMYEKNIDNAEYKGNISPLHWENSRAVLINSQSIINDFQNFIRPIFEVFPIRFAGLDVIIDEKNQKFLIEINSRPGFAHFIADNGEKRIVELYSNILRLTSY